MIKKSQLDKALRNSPQSLSKIIMVQEAQIQDLERKLKATESVLLAVSFGNYDVVDPQTGEVHKVFWK